MLKINYEAKRKRKRERQRQTERLTRVKVIRKERWKRYSDGHNSRRREEKREEGRKGWRERQLSSCPSPHAARTPPWGDSDFKPLPCFIFPWLLQPDQSSALPSVTQPSSVQPGPQGPQYRAGGRQICKRTTGIPILEVDFKGLYQCFCMCSTITTIHIHFTLLSAVSKHAVLF